MAIVAIVYKFFGFTLVSLQLCLNKEIIGFCMGRGTGTGYVAESKQINKWTITFHHRHELEKCHLETLIFELDKKTIPLGLDLTINSRGNKKIIRRYQVFGGAVLSLGFDYPRFREDSFSMEAQYFEDFSEPNDVARESIERLSRDLGMSTSGVANIVYSRLL